MYIYIYIERERERDASMKPCDDRWGVPHIHLRPISLLRLSMLRFVASKFAGSSPWT